MSFRLPAFPGDDPCDLLPVLLEFDVKGLVAKNGVLFSNKYDPLPLPVLGLVLIPLAPTLELPYSFSHNLHLTQLALLLSICYILFFFCINGSSFLCLSALWFLPPISPWLSHVLFESTGAKGGNEIWQPSLNGHAHILCNYLRLRTGAQLSIYKSVPLPGPNRLLKPYPVSSSW